MTGLNILERIAFVRVSNINLFVFDLGFLLRFDFHADRKRS
jgi:hypothetical protein